MARQAHAALEANPRTQSTEDLYNKLFDPVDTARDNVKRILKGVGDRIPGGSNPGSDRTDENEIVRFYPFSAIAFKRSPFFCLLAALVSWVVGSVQDGHPG